MLGLPILDVAIGIAFFYLMFALICTTVNETLARWFNKRPKVLEEAVIQLLGNQKAREVFQHPLVAALSRKKTDGKVEAPSYIPASTFATALVDLLTGTNAIRDTNALEEGIKALPPGVSASLTALYQKANGNFDVFHDLLETHFNNAMDRASGWYKRYVQKQTKVLAFIIVMWADFDTLHVAERLWTDSALRSAIVEDAKARAQARNSGDVPLAVYNSDQPDQGTAVEPGTSPLSDKEETLINSVTGWQRDLNELGVKVKAASEAAESDQKAKDNTVFWIKTQWFLMHLLGWLLSIFAISLGAPFWFDLLNRFMNLRNAGRAPDEPRAKNTSAPTREATA
jgi:hypothetical protein